MTETNSINYLDIICPCTNKRCAESFNTIVECESCTWNPKNIKVYHQPQEENSWQVCPYCNGQFMISPYECSVCKGEKIISTISGKPPSEHNKGFAILTSPES